MSKVKIHPVRGNTFASQNATVAVVLFFALSLLGAIQAIIDLSRPFEALVRVSGQPLRHSLQVMSEK
jgi:hypothetical protein